MVACDYFHIDENEKIIKKLSSSVYPISCGIMYNKKKFIKFGMYNPKFKHREEEEIRLRLGDKYNLYNLNIPLYKYKIHQNNKTKSNKYLIDFRKKIDRLRTKKILNNSVLISY